MIEHSASVPPCTLTARVPKTGRWRWLVVGGLLPLVAFSTASPAFSQQHNHSNQYSRQAGLPSGMLRYYEPHVWTKGKHPFSSYCCNQRDCGFAKPGSVTWTPDGYRVMMPDGHVQIVPEDSPAIRPVYEKGYEKETRFAACILQKGAAIDAYLENLSPGAVESPSAWYVRCLYIGRSGQ